MILGDLNSVQLRGFYSGDILYSVSSDSWGENTVTWNNEPGPGVLLGTINVLDAGPVAFDITAYVESELAGDKWVSLLLLVPGQSLDLRHGYRL